MQRFQRLPTSMFTRYQSRSLNIKNPKNLKCYGLSLESPKIKVLSLLEACFDLISGSSLHMEIQIMGGKITKNLRFKSPLRKVKKILSFFSFHFQILHRFVTMVLDRLFLWLFTLACVMGTGGIILRAPSIHDMREPIDAKVVSEITNFNVHKISI